MSFSFIRNGSLEEKTKTIVEVAVEVGCQTPVSQPIHTTVKEINVDRQLSQGNIYDHLSFWLYLNL